MPVDSLEFHLQGLSTLVGSNLSRDIFAWLCPCRVERLRVLVSRLDKIKTLKRPSGNKRTRNAWTGMQSNLVGRVFESLVSELFLESRVSSHRTNVITSTNEIDILLTLGPFSIFVPPFSGLSCVHGESKCHVRAPKTEWVGELSQNAINAGTRLAILFVYCSPRKLDSAFRTNIAITAANGATVVPFGRTQIEEVLAGTPVLDVLCRQHVDARNFAADLHV